MRHPAPLRLALTVVAAVAVLAGACTNDPTTAQHAPTETTPTTAAATSTDPAPATSSTTTSSSTSSTEAGRTTTSPATEPAAPGDLHHVIAQLRVEPEPPRHGYNRDLFPHWIDEDGDGCRTRAEVLITQSVTRPQIDPSGCRVIAGDWHSLYDDTWHTSPADIEIDHVVALAEAWDSGAATWSTERRQAFANDLTPGALRAVSSPSNQSKADKDPANWRPPNQSAWCQYATDWATTKLRWDLSADPAEIAALNDMANTCPTPAPAPGTLHPGPAPSTQHRAAPTPGGGTPSGHAPTGADCDPNYEAADGSCIGRYDLVGDLNCGDLTAAQKPVRVIGTDPHRLDGDGDGWGCQR